MTTECTYYLLWPVTTCCESPQSRCLPTVIYFNWSLTNTRMCFLLLVEFQMSPTDSLAQPQPTDLHRWPVQRILSWKILWIKQQNVISWGKTIDCWISAPDDTLGGVWPKLPTQSISIWQMWFDDNLRQKRGSINWLTGPGFIIY